MEDGASGHRAQKVWHNLDSGFIAGPVVAQDYQRDVKG
jgi:hypothetical protein